MTPPQAGAPTAYTDLIELLRDLPVAVREKRRRTGQSLRAAGDESGVGGHTIHRVEKGSNVMTSHTVAILQWLAQ